jgi:hypothetical protein
MDIRLGKLVLRDVQIPLLWGSRAISQDRDGHLTVMDMSQGVEIEIMGDRPVPGVQTVAGEHGFDVLRKGKPLYHYDPEQKTLSSIDLDLPDCQVGQRFVRVGATTFGANTITGFEAAIMVTADATWVGAPLPPKLQRLLA